MWCPNLKFLDKLLPMKGFCWVG